MLLWALGWLCGTLIWSWYEIVKKLPVPAVFMGDMLFFLLPVALMGALAVLPHAKQYEGPLAFSWLDFLILLLFWIYLYAIAVIPWEFVSLNTPQYSRNFDLLYAVETALPVFGLIPMFLRAQGRWRSLYGMLFWASATFAVAVQVVNHALEQYILITRGSLIRSGNGHLHLYLHCRLGFRQQPAATRDRRQHPSGWRARLAAGHGGGNLAAVFRTMVLLGDDADWRQKLLARCNRRGAGRTASTGVSQETSSGVRTDPAVETDASELPGSEAFPRATDTN